MIALTPKQLTEIRERGLRVSNKATNDDMTYSESRLAHADRKRLSHHITMLEGELTETKRMLVNETETLNELVDDSEILESSLHKAEAQVSKLEGELEVSEANAALNRAMELIERERADKAEATLKAIGESEKDLVGILKQTILSVPANGNLTVIQIANNAIEYHEALTGESK